MEQPNEPAPREPGEHDHLRELVDASAGLLAGRDELSRALARWAAEVAVDDAAARRARERWLHLQAAEEANVAGTLLDLAEGGRPVIVDAAGFQVRGNVIGLGVDFVALRSDQGQQVIVSTDAIEVFRSEPGADPVSGDRTSLVEVSLASVLGTLAADRPEVAVRTPRAAIVRGELRGAGADVVTLRTGGDPPAAAWVPFAAIAVIILHP